MSLNSDSNISDEEDEESKSENRAKRIEELAKKMLGEGGETRSRHPSDPGVNSRSLLDIMGELDTVSELILPVCLFFKSATFKALRQGK